MSGRPLSYLPDELIPYDESAFEGGPLMTGADAAAALAARVGPEPSNLPAPEDVDRGDRRGLHPLLLMGPPAGHMADAWTTRRAHQYPGIQEGNRVMRGIADSDAMYAVKGGIGVGTSLGAELLARKGQRGLGKALAVIGTVLPLAAAGWNLAQTEKARRALP